MLIFCQNISNSGTFTPYNLNWFALTNKWGGRKGTTEFWVSTLKKKRST